jgi:hypothetical protein
MADEIPATLTADITLVEHGYQVDIVNRSRATSDGNGVERNSICRDFGGHYEIPDMAETLVSAMENVMRNIESIHRERIRQSKRVICPNCGRSVNVNSTGKIRFHRSRTESQCPGSYTMRPDA